MPRGAGAFDARMNAAAGIPGIPGAPPVKRSAGRPPSATWALLTDTVGAHKLPSAVCKSCKTVVNYHKKREAAEAHLNQCPPFLEAMMALAPEYRPDWLGVKKQKRERGERKPSSSQPKPPKQPKQAVQDPAVAEALAAAAAYAAASNMYHDASLAALTQSKSESTGAAMTLAGVNKSSAAFLQNDRFQELLAMHFYTTGAPLTRARDAFLTQAVATLRPDAQLPAPDALTGALLDASYKSAQDKTAAVLSTGGTFACLVRADADTGARYMAVTPRQTLFLKAESAAGNTATSETLAASIATAMKSAGGLVAGAVTPSTPAYAGAWPLLQREFPSRFFYGCASDALAQTIDDLFAIQTAPASGIDSAVAAVGPSPFTPALADVATECQDVALFFYSRAHVRAALAKRTGAPVRMPPSLLECLTAVLTSAAHMAEIVRCADFLAPTLSASEQSVRTRIQRIVLDAAFARHVAKAIAVLRPLDAAVRTFARANVPVSDVTPALHGITAAYASLTTAGELSPAERDYVCAHVTARGESLSSPAHIIAYLLDPRFLGDAFTSAQRQAAETALTTFPIDDAPVGDVAARATSVELANFLEFARTDRRSESPHFVMLVKGTRTPLQFWQLEGKEWPRLQRIAFKVFALVASTAVAARTVATYFADAQARDADDDAVDASSETAASVPAATVEKLVYIRANARGSADVVSTASAFAHANYYWESEDVAII